MKTPEKAPYQKEHLNGRLEDKIKLLIKKKLLNISLVKTSQTKYKYGDVVSKDLTDPCSKKIIEVGLKCKGIVVRKEQTNKQLWIHLTKIVLSEPQNKYLKNEKSPCKPKNSNSSRSSRTMTLQFFVKFPKKQPFSIFTYINSYKDIKIGSEVSGMLVRKEWRNQNGELTQFAGESTQNNVWFEISVKNQPPKSLTKFTLPNFGIFYNQRFSQVVDSSYQKTKNFSIGQLTLYEDNFENNDIIPELRQSLSIDLNQNINPISNIKALKYMHLNLQRIRQTQEKKWASDHFMEGMQFLKRGNNQCAIQNFELAQKFDKNNEKIHIAKGCALANMNNFSEGLREIKEALRINPDNEQANQYYKTIREKLRQKETGPNLRKKHSSNSSPKQISKGG